MGDGIDTPSLKQTITQPVQEIFLVSYLSHIIQHTTSGHRAKHTLAPIASLLFVKKVLTFSLALPSHSHIYIHIPKYIRYML